jgi:signal transduction histidine kinase
MISYNTKTSSLPPRPGPLDGLLMVADHQVPDVALATAIALMLPGTQLDVLLQDSRSGPMRLLASTRDARSGSPPAAVLASEQAFVRWLDGLGYTSVTSIPISDMAQQFGTLMIVQRNGAPDHAIPPQANALAQAFALRLRAQAGFEAGHAVCRALQVAEARYSATKRLRERTYLTAGAIHNLGNMLTVLTGYVGMLEQALLPERYDDLHVLMYALGDTTRIVQSVFRQDQPKPVVTSPRTDVPAVIKEVLALTQPCWARAPGLRVTTDLARVPMAQVDTAELRDALLNLVVNALQAMPDGGTLTVRCFREQNRIVVEVVDTGVGISREQQALIFDPLQASYPAGQELGLAISRAVIERGGGQLTVESAPGQGARFCLMLPIAAYDRSYAIGEAEGRSTSTLT